jgi:DNA-directed RNA polymerase delta subunit
MSVLYIFSGYVFIKKKRKIEIEFYNITEKFRSWKTLSRQEFNKKLEDFYNGEKEFEDLVIS